MTYNILHHNVDLNSFDFFQLCSNSITRGHNFKIFKPHAQTLVRDHPELLTTGTICHPTLPTHHQSVTLRRAWIATITFLLHIIS